MDLTKPIDIASVNNTSVKYKKEIQTLDMLSANAMLQHFTLVSGVTDSIVLSHMIPGDNNSRGYDGTFTADKKIGTIVPRTLTVRPIVYELSDEPERLRRTFLTEVRGAVENPESFYRWLIDWCIAKASEELYNVLMVADYNSGTAGSHINLAFDGLETIIADEITATNISAANGNLYDPGAVYTSANTGDLLLAQWRAMPATFRMKGGDCHISVDMGDLYDDWYKAEHDAPPMVDTAGQTFLDGTNGKCRLIRHSNIANQRVIMTRKENIVYGTDKMSDMSSLRAFESGNPYLFTAVMKYVFGIQIVTLDKSMFSVNKLYSTSGSGS